MTTDQAAATPETVVAALRATQFTYRDEDALQAGLAAALDDASIPNTREVRLGAGVGRIDLMAGPVGIEVKVAGSVGAVVRQLERYAAHPDIEHLVLVTTEPQHRDVLRLVTGCPVTLFDLARHQAF